jgi:hypothetical protein
MKNKFLFLIILTSLFIGAFTFVSRKAYAYDGCGCASDGSYYCYNCDSCGTYNPFSCHFPSSNCSACCLYVVWENNSSKCDDDDCSTNCNACANYSYLQASATSYGTKDVSCTAECGNTDWDTCYCTSQCTLDSCPSQYATSSQGHGSLAYDTCTNQCGQSRTQTCYCHACTLDSCPAEYSTTPQGYGNLTYDTCTNDCGETRNRTCYCNQCTPPTCDPGTTSDSSGDGDLADTKTCTNDCGVSNSRNCYYSCSEATCTTLTSSVSWTDDDCTGNENCRTIDKTVTINDPSPGCAEEEAKTCYIQNYRPESPTSANNLDVNIVIGETFGVNSYTQGDSTFEKFIQRIKAQSDGSSILGYSSNTHSGTQLNNPLTVNVQYSDQDGVEDMEALYVWWSTSGTKDFITPNRIANPAENLSGMTANTENFGFLVGKDDAGNWTNFYKPHIEGSTAAWVKEDGDDLVILGPTAKSMVNVNDITVTDIGQDNILTLSFNLLFLWEGDHERIANAEYNIWGLANDSVGFLPFNESDDIEDSEDEFWNNSGITWNVDLDKPEETNQLVSASVDENLVSITFGVEDQDSNLARVRLDACRNGGDEDTPNDLVIGTRSYPLEYCDLIDFGSSYPADINMETGNNILGTDPINPESSTYAIDGIADTLEVDLGGNSNGSITFYLTSMDEAGNWYQDTYIHRLGEWIAVKDAFVFGLQGVSSSTRILNNDWDDTPLFKSDYGFEYDKIDLTDQALLGGYRNANTFLRFLEKYEVNNSFTATTIPGVYINSPYLELIGVYQERIDLIGDEMDYQEELLSASTLSGDILSDCDTEPNLCILKYAGEDLEISSGAVCDGKGLIATNGNVTIHPDFTNADNSSACIILANGNITIANGTDKSSSHNIDYDVLEAFVIANGEINIPTDSAGNGLIVEGGLTAFNKVSGNASIFNQRNININFRGMYPVMLVKGNSKYGLLSRELFGSQMDVFRIEVGYKPY